MTLLSYMDDMQAAKRVFSRFHTLFFYILLITVNKISFPCRWVLIINKLLLKFLQNVAKSHLNF